MKRIWMLMTVPTVIVFSSGCMAKEDTVLHKEKVENSLPKTASTQSTAIVIMNKGVTYDEAEKVLKEHKMYILKSYKTLSEQNHQLYLSVSAPMSSDEMLKILQDDRHVFSVSSNQKRTLY